MKTQASKWSRAVSLAARLGTGLLLIVLAYSCGTVPGLREESTATYIRVPFVRVLLDESQDSVTVGAQSQFAVECLRDLTQEVFYSTSPVHVRNLDQRLVVMDHHGAVLFDDLDEVNIIPRGARNPVRLYQNRYRGIMKVLPSGQNVRLVNIVYMEDYLRGVVPPEIGDRSENEIEAVKAQALAGRTYALSHLQQYPGEPYDMKASIADQVYSGVSVENKLVNEAIDATAGEVIMYGEEFANAYYHSTCGGMTDDIAAVWDRRETPYLKPVEDSGACSWSKYYVWQEVFTEEQLRGRLEQYLSGDRGRDMRLGRITGLNIIDRTPGGRVATLKVSTESGDYRFFKDRIRWVIGRTSNPDLILPSDRFDIFIDSTFDGLIRTVTFKGRGYGHGVGMCQCGAIGLARDGWPYDRILKLYYQGVQIERKY